MHLLKIPVRSQAVNFFAWIPLFLFALATSLGLRIFSIHNPYFCWDEHDYIAHNIYHKLQLSNFEIPFSNKWPLGHIIIYFLTSGCNPFDIGTYRVATAFVDATTASLLAYLACPGKGERRNRWVAVALFSGALTVVLRSSAGILAESLANPFLVAGVLGLQKLRSACLGAAISVFFFACACWVKPTAFLPALLVASFFLWHQRQNRGVFLIFSSVSLISLGLSLGVFFWNQVYGSGLFFLSAIKYNFSDSVFGPRAFWGHLDVVLAGVAFFQFTFPWLLFTALLLLAGLKLSRHGLPLYWLIGAVVSLAIRPAGAQTTYWLYLLPPLLWLGWLGWQDLSASLSRQERWILTGFVVIPMAFGWMINLAGPSLNLHPGGRGGIRHIQTQITDLEPALQALRGHPRYREAQSRLLLWGMPWQVFYLGQCIPATSLLTSESWAYGIAHETQRRLIAEGLDRADFVWVDEGPGAAEIRGALAQSFSPFFKAPNRTLYARINGP